MDNKKEKPRYWFDLLTINSYSLKEKLELKLLNNFGFYITHEESRKYSAELFSHLVGHDVETLGDLINLDKEDLKKRLGTSNQKVVIYMKELLDIDSKEFSTENYDFDYHNNVLTNLVHRCGLQMSYETKIPFASLSIYDLGLSEDLAINLYSKAGISNFISLLDFSENELLKIDNIDKKSIKEIKKFLKGLGFNLKKDFVKKSPKKKKIKSDAELMIEELHRRQEEIAFFREVEASYKTTENYVPSDEVIKKVDEIRKKYNL